MEREMRREMSRRSQAWLVSVGLMLVALAMALAAGDCGHVAAQPDDELHAVNSYPEFDDPIPLVAESPSTTVERPRYRPVQDKETALMLARIVANETAMRLPCVPWERRAGCRNDMGAILQLALEGAADNNRSVYDQLRLHSPWATGRCVELGWTPDARRDRSVWETLPRRCKRMRLPAGNVPWTSRLDWTLAETDGWRAVYAADTWAAPRGRRDQLPSFRDRFAALLTDAYRLVTSPEPWRPCTRTPDTWGGWMDPQRSYHARVDCGLTRNTFYSFVQAGSVSAPVAAGDREPSRSPRPR